MTPATRKMLFGPRINTWTRYNPRADDMNVVESLYIEAQNITFVTCQGDDIRPDTRLEAFSAGGVVYEAIRPAVHNSLSNRLQLTFGVNGRHEIPRGPITVIR